MLYKIYNAPMPTTASIVPVTTGTAIKTMLQVKMGATKIGRVCEWGICGRGSAAAEPGIIELIETDVAATVTAHAASGIHKFDEAALLAGDPTTDMISVGTAATGYTASAEGTITDMRVIDAQLVAPTNQFILQFPLGLRGAMQPGKFTRIRVKFGTAVDTLCYMLVEL